MGTDERESETVRVYLYSREDGAPVHHRGMRLRVMRYRWMEVGGPDECWLEAQGSETALLETADLLRCPLEVQRPDGTPVWWGFVDGVWVRQGLLELGVSLDGMANRVRTRYTPVLPSLDHTLGPTWTAWQESTDSQASYGVKELQIDLGQAGKLLAEKRAAIALSECRYPVPGLNPRATGSELPGAGAARLRARGWWHTTGWRFYEQPCGLEQTDLPGGGGIPVGTPDSQHIRQAVDTAGSLAAWPADRLWARVYRQGAPTDGLVARILDGSGGQVGQSVVVPASSLPIGGGWLEFPLAAPVNVPAGGRLDLVFQRTGGLDPQNYYRLGTSGLTSRAGLLHWDGGAYQPSDPPVTLLFKLEGSEDTVQQMARMLAPGCGGQFLSGLELPPNSGVTAPLWRAGERTARQEVEALLRGGSGEGRRYLATVLDTRRAEVYPAPLPGAADWTIRSDGRLADATGARVPAGVCPVGMWVQARDWIPVIVSGQQMADPTRFWVEQAEWDAEKGELRLVPGGGGLTG